MVLQSYTIAAVASLVGSHEYLKEPLARTSDCLLNAVVMGSSICTKGVEEVQCLEDQTTYTHLFHVNSAYEQNACGGSLRVHGSRGTQGLLQNCGDISTNPRLFDMTQSGPHATTEWTAGAEVELRVHGFFHQGVMRVALCFVEDSDCMSPADFNHYVLGYHFTEGTAGAGSDIYSVDMPVKVTLPNRNGRAVLQWLVDAEDVRSYVSCADVELSGAVEPVDASAYVCNGHPLCNCTLATGEVHLGGACPKGTAASTSGGQATGTDIVKQYKEQVGVDEFCALCITNGCPSTCGGIYKGYYQGDLCTNTPVIEGCGASHVSGLPRYVDCTTDTCTSFGWSTLMNWMV